MVSRRHVLVGSVGLATALGGSVSGRAVEIAVADRLALLEQQLGGSLGAAILDTGTGRTMSRRGDERFPLCSTHKALSAAFVLARVDAGRERLDRRVAYGPEVLVDYSPVTKARAGQNGMTVGDLCAAAIEVSDNTAANLLLDSFGGPTELTGFLRKIGDPVTRLDRHEPELNEALHDDPRDTTTPLAMASTLAQLATGSVLSPASKAQYAAWLVGCATGLHKLRAGLPADWRAGDKTGSGSRRAGNDVMVAWPPGRPPLVVTAYTIDPVVDDTARDSVLAQVGQIAAR